MKYIIVTGGVMSGLGKGITIASIGRNLKNKGYKVTAIKIEHPSAETLKIKDIKLRPSRLTLTSTSIPAP